MIRKILNYIPAQIQAYYVRLFLVILLFSLLRIIFLISNYDSFNGITLTDWKSGFWFDLVTIALIYLPHFILCALPHPFQQNKLIWILRLISFLIPTLLSVALNLMDSVYFHFTQKRSTFDLISTFSEGNDVGQLVGTFLKNYWYLILIFLFIVYYSIKIYVRIDRTDKTKPKYIQHSILMILLLAIQVIIGRGGLIIHRPITPLDATLFTVPERTGFILNSSFTMVKSIQSNELEEKNYFPLEIAQQEFDMQDSIPGVSILPSKTNVIIVMLESFGREWCGSLTGQQSYMPYFDSLSKKGVLFESGFSNGKKSIEAVPTIVGSLPSLMDNPFISSPYSNNQTEQLATLLKKRGYHTNFFHGATNGSMRFDSYTKQAGFAHYFGRKEYNNDKHFDGTWGILDEYFNTWMIKKTSEIGEPFLSTLFTLSSHHPYYIPERWKKRIPVGPQPICSSTYYADQSLRLMMEKAQKQPWYKRTLFVFVADHTPSTTNSYYNLRSQLYRIPILLFDPSGKIKPKREKNIFQQADIMPTVLDLLNIKTKYVGIGRSYYSKKSRFAVSYLEGTYSYFYGDYMLLYTNEKAVKLVNYKSTVGNEIDSMAQKPELTRLMTKKLRALIQVYHHRLRKNELTIR